MRSQNPIYFTWKVIARTPAPAINRWGKWQIENVIIKLNCYLSITLKSVLSCYFSIIKAQVFSRAATDQLHSNYLHG